MRREPTQAEQTLWSHLRALRGNTPFRRQHVIGSYIVDFYCSQAQLAVEVDGPYHADIEEQDSNRTAYLNALGIRVIRFTNDQVLNNIDEVLTSVLHAIESSPEQPHP
jgi:very-short-patch-repair endonuclease